MHLRTFRTRSRDAIIDFHQHEGEFSDRRYTANASTGTGLCGHDLTKSHIEITSTRHHAGRVTVFIGSVQALVGQIRATNVIKDFRQNLV